ncbi:hypothetical protein [Agromyces albus]|uniref:hypothetical protein n=1 Tax=Agromyces albus TaxID=205332 RepID=UPI002781D0A2|nr:hypothetical protein [Agromyces albus]MDQ0574725.1 hypothetical protein [Agromyces albus]
MSDQDWQAPGGPPTGGSAPDAAGTPYGAPANVPPAPGTPPPLPPQPPTGAYAPQPGTPGGWTPPPKPGLLPLRPLSFGTLLWAPFRTLRRNPAATFGSGLVVQLVSVIATAAVVVPFLMFAIGRVESASDADFDTVLAGTVGGFILLMLVPVAITLVAGAFLQGVMVLEVASGTLGERLGFGALWRRTAKRIWPLIGWTALVAAAVLAAIAALVGIIVVAAGISPTALGVSILVAVLLGLGLAVLGAWIGVKLSLVPSVIVLEHAGLGAAIRRSWQLTDGYYWRTFGILLLVSVILNVAAQVVVQPISLVGTILAVIIDPTGAGTAVTITIITTVVTMILSILIGAITAVVQAALVAVLYIDLRMRKEGLDLELERHVELRDSGQPVTDPYLAPSPSAPAGSEPAATWS